MRVLLLVCGLAAAAEVQLNPITRVAQLLEGLATKVAQDGKAEQDLYDGFKCWCMKVINAKSASLDTNEQRVKELAAYIDDLSSGRIELTSERSNLEEEIKALEKAIQEEEQMREKEHKDFLAAKDEMDKAVAALEKAVATLGEGTQGSMELTAVHTELAKVLQVGQGFLAKQDLSGLAKALDVPEADWNKLNREATHKQKYTARSGGIQKILGDMLQTFTDNLNEAIASEDKAKADFDTLLDAKQTQLTSAKDALLEKSGENGARGSALADAEGEKSDLEGQNERDTGFLADTKVTCEEKASEWSERKRLRAGEIASIQEAIGILRSDDARDTFSRSLESQGFIQLSKKDNRFQSALAVLKKLTRRGDERVGALATTLVMLNDGPLKEKEEPAINEANPFLDVFVAIDKLVADLKAEEKDDLEKKDECEKERAENAQTAKMTAKHIDTNTETIDRLTSQIEAAQKQIAEINATIYDLEIDKRDAADQRTQETREWVNADADDAKAAELVDAAIGVLKKFRADEGLDLVQVRRVHQEPFTKGGEAPPPPPTAPGGDYGDTSSGEHQGIVAIMEMVRDDIIKDQKKAKDTEDESESRHQKFIEDTDASIKAHSETMATLDGEVAADEQSRTDEETTKASNQGELNSTLAFLKDIAPGCDFMAVNFDTRLKNRQAESDGLLKAKAILNGAEGF